MERNLSRAIGAIVSIQVSLFFASLALAAATTDTAQNTVTAETLPLFRPVVQRNGDPKPLQLEIRTDFSKILGRSYGYGTEKRDRVRVPAEIRLTGIEARKYPVVQMAEISGRGGLRGNECPFPPLKIEFKGRPAEPSYFRGINEVRVVTHCGKNIHQRNDSLRDQLFKEFTIYRLHAIAAAPVSFQVRLVKVRYVDTSGKHGEAEEFAIFVEDLSDLTRRLGVKRLYSHKDQDVKGFDPSLRMTDSSQFAPEKWRNMLLFQQMVGNADFNIGHNLKGIVGTGGWEPIPYDFDYVNLFDRKSLAISGEAISLHLSAWGAEPPGGSVIAENLKIAREMAKLLEATALISDADKNAALTHLDTVVRSIEQIPRK